MAFRRSLDALESIYARITMNRLTAFFFLFGFLHCFAQGIIHSFLFTVDNEYNVFLDKIVRAAQIPARNHTDLRGSSHNYRLEMCNYIPHSPDHCSFVFTAGVDDQLERNQSNISMNDYDIIRGMIRDGVTVTANLRVDSPPSLILFDSQNRSVVLNEHCTRILLYPQQHMHNAKREDLTFVIFQFWLFVISLIAMFYNSVPHILAGLGARILLTAWAAYALWRTSHQKEVYHQLIGATGTPCSVEIFQDYFGTRFRYEIPDLVLSCTALLIFSYLSYALIKLYNSQSLKCVGAPEHINHIYKYFMAVQACLQLELFVLVTGMGLWIDQLHNSYINTISDHTDIYEATWIATTVLLLPWLAMGWYAIRREMKRVMIVFIGVAFIFLFAWSMMFYSQVYRWMYYAWPNLGCYITASIILILATMVLGIICRMNFGKGLKQYLHAEAALAATGFAPEIFDHEVGKSSKDATEHLADAPFPSVPASTAAELPTPTYCVPTLHTHDPPELEGQHAAAAKERFEPLRRQRPT